MSFIRGGDTDKRGNYYENKFVVYNFSKLLNGEFLAVQQETLIQDEESGVDVITIDKDNNKTYYQCKARNGINNTWTIGDLVNKEILRKAIKHTRQGLSFVFVAPQQISTTLQDFCSHSQPFDNLSDFENNVIKTSGKQLQAEYKKIKDCLVSGNSDADILSFFHKFTSKCFAGDEQHIKDLLKVEAKIIEVDTAYDLLNGYVATNNKLALKITEMELRNYLKGNAVSFFAIDEESESARIAELQTTFVDSISRKLINNSDFERKEKQSILNSMDADKFTIIHGEPSSGKSAICKQICDELTKKNALYIPINININKPSGTLLSYSRSLGLSQTMSAVLNALTPDDKSAYIILDQLDNIKWKASATQEAENLCWDIIKESLLYSKVKVIFIIRKIDKDTIRNGIEMEKRSRIANIGEVEIRPLDEQEIQKLIPMNEFASMTIGTKNLLKTIGNIKLYLEIKKKQNFATTPELITAFIDEKVQDASQKGFLNAKEMIEELVAIMTKEDSLSVAKSQISLKFSNDNIEILKKVGIIDETAANQVTFVHQTIFDFFISRGLYAQVVDEKLPIIKVLKPYNAFPLEKHEVLKQFIELLVRNHVNRFCFWVDEILFSNRICFVIKRLFLTYFSVNSHGLEGSLKLFEKIITSKRYGEKYLPELAFSKKVFVERLIATKLIDRLLTQKTWCENTKIGLDLLMSIAEESKPATDYLAEYIRDLKDESIITQIEVRIKTKTKNERLFDIKLELIGKNIIKNHYIQWKEILAENIDRAYKYLELLFTADEKTNVRLDIAGNEQQALLAPLLDKYGEKLNKLTKSYIDREETNKWHLKNYNRCMRPYGSNEDYAIEFFARTIKYSTVDEIWSMLNDKNYCGITLSIIGENNFDKDKGRALLKLMVKENYIQSYQQATYHENINNLKAVLEEYSTGLTKKELEKLETQIIRYKKYDLIERAKRCIALHAENKFYSFWGEEQKVLLEALPFEQLSQDAQNLLRCLQRKFVKHEQYDPHYTSGVVSYNVVSGVNPQKKKLSKNDYIAIVTSPQIAQRDDHHSMRDIYDDKKGVCISFSKHDFTSMIYDAAYDDKAEFVDILLNTKGIQSDFLYVILEAISHRISNKTCTNDATAEAILQVYKKYFDINDDDTCRPFISFVQTYRCFDDWVISKLLEITKKPNDTNYSNDIDYSNLWQRHFSSLQSGAINALSGLVYDLKQKPEWFDDIYDKAVSENDGMNAISCAELLLSYYHMNESECVDKAVQLLSKHHFLFQDNSMIRLLNASMEKHYETYKNIFLQVERTGLRAEIKNKVFELEMIYFCFWGYFKQQVINNIKRTKKVEGQELYTSEKFPIITVLNIIENNKMIESIQRRAETAIRWLIKYNSLYAGEFLNYIRRKDNFNFFIQTGLLYDLVKNGLFFDADFRVHNVIEILKELPSLAEYKNFLLAVGKSLCERNNRFSLYSQEIFNWFIKLYFELIDRKEKAKFLKLINSLQERFIGHNLYF